MTRCLPRRPLFHRPLPPHHCPLTHPLNPLNPPHFRRLEQSIFDVLIICPTLQQYSRPSSRRSSHHRQTRWHLPKSSGIKLTAQNNQVFLQGSVPAASISWQVGLPFSVANILFCKATNQTNSMQGDISGHLPLTFPLPMDPCLHLHTLTQGEQIQGVPDDKNSYRNNIKKKQKRLFSHSPVCIFGLKAELLLTGCLPLPDACPLPPPLPLLSKRSFPLLTKVKVSPYLLL